MDPVGSKYFLKFTPITGATLEGDKLTFHSSTYEWLAVSGAREQYKSAGTINGAGNCGFMLTAIDGQINGGGGGSIVIQAK